MELAVLGGDLRYAYLAAQAMHQGIDAVAVGFDTAPVGGIVHKSICDIAQANYIVMPNPFTKGLDWPYATEKPSLEQIFKMISPGTTLMMMGINGIPSGSISEKLRVVDLMDDEVFVLENAHLSAEGAIYSVMKKATFSFYRTDCLVIGFGRIAAALTRMLTGFGARVTVAARRENARARARMFGAMSVSMEEIADVLPVQRVIFSTPPETVLFERELKAVRKDAMLVELASPPYGFDMELAQSLGVNAWLEPGIPGRYCPESAAKALLTSVEIIMKEKGGVAL